MDHEGRRKPKCLYVTLSTAQAEDRLRRSLYYQRTLPEALEGWDKLLITDSSQAASPAEGFEFLKADLFTQGKLNFARYRNISMQYAADLEYDWLIQSTADIVMLRPPHAFPDNGFTSVMTYHSVTGENIADTITRWKAGAAFPFIGTTYFLMSAVIFTRYSFYE